MKKSLLSALALCMGLAFSAQSQAGNGGAQLDLQSRAALREMKSPSGFPLQEASKKSPSRVSGEQEECRMVGAMVRVKEGTTREQLEAEGLQVQSLRGNIALVSMPLDEVETIAAQSRVIRQIQLPRAMKPMNDRMRVLTGVDAIHAGTGLPKAYTGKGVVTGIVDAGIDPNHLMFKNADGSPRIQYLAHITGTTGTSSGVSMKGYNITNMDEFTTDDATTFHGTHTLGTMAGSYTGASTVAELSGSTVAINQGANPFYGIATESDIIIGCGTLQDYYIALGMEVVLEYAYQMKMPKVINLSLGGTTGPHDGTSMISAYMAAAEKQDKVIICVAAGNDGDQPLVVSKTLSEDNTTVRSFIQPMYESYPVYNEDGTTYAYTNLRYGQVYVYSNDATPFIIKAVVYNKDRGTVTFEAPFSPDSDTEAIYYASPDYASDGDLTHTNFTNAFNGYVGVGGMVDEYSGRYYAIVDYFVEDNTAKNNGKYILGFVVEGQAGQHLDCYCDGSFTTLSDFGQEGWMTGSSDGTISDMACGDGILVVGSYNSRTDFASLSGNSYTYGDEMPEGKVSSFTSYGTTITGKKLPEVCAPGATIISSLSKPYADYTGISAYPDNLQASAKSGADTYYWMQCVGTSMASPVVAGSMALWLEADSTLTLADVKDIISKTSLRDADVNDDPRWGYGKFDALVGLKEVLRRKGMGIGATVSDNSRLLLTSDDLRRFNLFLGGARNMDVAIYDIAGREVARFSVQGDEADIDASGWAAGTYMVRVNGMYSGKMVVK
ncbi:MAG: S8 family peptidase [Paludibacteraceae bacterium]